MDRQAIGDSYELLGINPLVGAMLNGWFICPYCQQRANDRFHLTPKDLPVVDRGLIAVRLNCNRCGKPSLVRFHSSARLN